MSVYNTAHRLEKEIKNSSEYKEYQEIREKINNNPKTREMLIDFQKQQMLIQSKQLSGQGVSEEDKKKLNNLREIIELNANIKKYLEAEYRMGIMLNDLQKILFSDLEMGIYDEEEDDHSEHNHDHNED